MRGHLEETLRRILAEAVTTQVQDPRIGFVTISEVRMNRDNTVAKVFFTVMGDEDDRATTLAGLKSCRGFLRQQIGDQLRMRLLPELRFIYDDSLDRSFRLDELLSAPSKLEGDDDEGESSDAPKAEGD